MAVAGDAARFQLRLISCNVAGVLAEFITMPHRLGARNAQRPRPGAQDGACDEAKLLVLPCRMWGGEPSAGWRRGHFCRDAVQ